MKLHRKVYEQLILNGALVVTFAMHVTAPDKLSSVPCECIV